MYKSENTRREGRVLNFHHIDTENPSFSSTLLDKIYRSIDEGDTKGCSDMKFYTETTIIRHSKTNVRFNRVLQEEPNLCLNVGTQRTKQIDRKSHHDEDVLFFSSGSSSSDSSSGLLSSSSETESMYRAKSRGSCFAPSRPKLVKTTVHPERIISNDEDMLIKSKSRALKIYNNLKKVKQPISPGGKLTSFLNSLFINTKKTKTVPSYEDTNADRKAKSGLASTCSSASSFSRSCLSKNSSTSRDKLHNGVKRTVRFYPVSVIVDEDNQPCGHKCLYGGVTKKKEEKEEEKVLEKSKRVEEVAREFIREYHLNKKILRDFSMRKNEEEVVADDDDDVASCSSSDLFELDHLSVMENDNRYYEDLPVFETTHVSTNRAIRIM